VAHLLSGSHFQNEELTNLVDIVDAAIRRDMRHDNQIRRVPIDRVGQQRFLVENIQKGYGECVASECIDEGVVIHNRGPRHVYEAGTRWKER
jgi:hypothetical protein